MKITPKQTSTITIPVPGMRCASCVRHIEQKLTGTAGVTSAAVNLPMKQAHVEYDARKVTVPDLVQAVRDIGYEVPMEAEAPTIDAVEPEQDSEYIDVRRRFLMAAIL